MKRICMTFLACTSIIGSVQCLYAANQEKPMMKELQHHTEEINMEKIEIDQDTSHISPDTIRLASMKIDRQMNEEETIDTAESAEKGKNDSFRADKKLEMKAEELSGKEPAVAAKRTEAEERTISKEGKNESRVSEIDAAETKEAASQSIVEEAPVTVSKEEKVQECAAAETEKTTEPSAHETVITVTATAYTADCEGGSGVTYTGVDLKANPDAKVIAVDPSVIPLGTEVYVEGYGHAVAADIGGAIEGNKIDVFIPSEDEADSWGVQTVDVTIKH
ncbi:3D domain-containing protein [Pradoshia sp.]